MHTNHIIRLGLLLGLGKKAGPMRSGAQRVLEGLRRGDSGYWRGCGGRSALVRSVCTVMLVVTCLYLQAPVARSSYMAAVAPYSNPTHPYHCPSNPTHPNHCPSNPTHNTVPLNLSRHLQNRADHLPVLALL